MSRCSPATLLGDIPGANLTTSGVRPCRVTRATAVTSNRVRSRACCREAGLRGTTHRAPRSPDQMNGVRPLMVEVVVPSAREIEWTLSPVMSRTMVDRTTAAEGPAGAAYDGRSPGAEGAALPDDVALNSTTVDSATTTTAPLVRLVVRTGSSLAQAVRRGQPSARVGPPGRTWARALRAV